MNDSFNRKNKEHQNLIAKLNNSISDLKWYACEILRLKGVAVNPEFAIFIANKIENPPFEIKQIVMRYETIKESTPETANDLFYSTWRLLHTFDEYIHNLKNERTNV